MINGVETRPFEVSSIPLGVFFDGARDGSNAETRKREIVLVMT